MRVRLSGGSRGGSLGQLLHRVANLFSPKKPELLTKKPDPVTKKAN